MEKGKPGSARVFLRVDQAAEWNLLCALAVSHFSLLVTGEVHPVQAGIIIVSLFAALLLPQRLKNLGSLFWNALLLLALVAGLLIALLPPRAFESYYHGIVSFLMNVVSIRYFTRQTEADDLVLYLLCLLEMAAATVISTSIFFLLLLLSFLVLILSGLMLTVIRRETTAKEGEPKLPPPEQNQGLSVAGVSSASRLRLPLRFFRLPLISALLIFVFGFLIFFVIPRLGFALFAVKTGKGATVSGFTERVELGTVGRIMERDTLVMRVKMPGVSREEGPFYFRGNALNHYDGRVWEDTLGSRRVQYSSFWQVVRFSGGASLEGSIQQEVILEPTGTTVLFGLAQVIALATPYKARAIVEYENDYFGFLPSEPIEDRVMFTVWSRHSPRGMQACRQALEKPLGKFAPKELTPYLQLPPGRERISELAKNLAGNQGNQCDQVQALLSYFQKNFTYNLHTPSDQAKDPIHDFLFNTHAGYCEYFATAMALMLRSLGIPCRVAAGYLAQDYNPLDNFFRVRENNAHTWVEVLLPNGEWLLVDPTPPVIREEPPAWLKYYRDLADSIRYRWERYVLDLSIGEQFNFFLRARRNALALNRELSQLPTQLKGLIRSSFLFSLIMVTALGVFLYWFWTWRQIIKVAGKGPDRLLFGLVRDYQRLLNQLAKLGFPRREAETPRELVARVRAAGAPFAPDLGAATELYLAARFGNQPLSPAQAAIQKALTTIKKTK